MIMTFIRKYKMLISFLLIGIIFRLIYSAFFNHMIDYMNILALTRSITETDSLSGGFLAIKRLSHEAQLYGRIYYQVAGLWLQILDRVGILHITYLFDTTPYNNPHAYLIGLGQWSPPLYQLTAIKLAQFFWDIPFVFFLYKLAQELDTKKPHYIILFWALAPFLVMVGYGIFMSDLAMVSCLVGGIWLWTRALKIQNTSSLLPGVLSIGLLVLGAVIKLVPLLIIPFVIVSVGKNTRSTLLLLGTTFLAYFAFSQPWSPDASLMKQHFLMSKETTAILNFNLNGIPVFLLLYCLFFLITFLKRQDIFTKPINATFITSFIIILVYLTNSINFVQFQVWLTPFVAIIGLMFPEYSWLLLINIIALLLRAIASSDYFSILLSPAIGSGYDNNLSNPTLIGHFIKPEIYVYISDTIISVGYLLSGYFIFTEIFRLKNFIHNLIPQEMKLSFVKLVFLGFVAYFICVGIDYSIKSRYILLPHNNYSYSNDLIYLSHKPLIISVVNPQGRRVHALDIMGVSKGTVYNENTILEFRKNDKLIYKQEINDNEFPTSSDNVFTIYLKQPVDDKKFDIWIYKNEKYYNQIAFFKGTIASTINTTQNKLYAGYDTPQPQNILSLQFHTHIFPLFLRGNYGFAQIMEGILEHVKTRPRFYFFGVYFIVILCLLLLVSLLNLGLVTRFLSKRLQQVKTNVFRL